jgi:hypothetical protein
MRLGMERHSQLMNFLRKVSISLNLNEDRISKRAGVMDQVRQMHSRERKGWHFEGNGFFKLKKTKKAIHAFKRSAKGEAKKAVPKQIVENCFGIFICLIKNPKSCFWAF